MAKQKSDALRPVTLYVSKIETNEISLDYMERPRVTTMDLEMTLQDAQILSDFLLESLKAKHVGAVLGAVRVRFEGNLVHG